MLYTSESLPPTAPASTRTCQWTPPPTASTNSSASHLRYKYTPTTSLSSQQIIDSASYTTTPSRTPPPPPPSQGPNTSEHQTLTTKTANTITVHTGGIQNHREGPTFEAIAEADRVLAILQGHGQGQLQRREGEVLALAVTGREKAENAEFEFSSRSSPCPCPALKIPSPIPIPTAKVKVKVKAQTSMPMPIPIPGNCNRSVAEKRRESTFRSSSSFCGMAMMERKDEDIEDGPAATSGGCSGPALGECSNCEYGGGGVDIFPLVN
ncbi:MAG: hypothetical protein MMC33_008479 [Icmadophila ericetorum]|nr:hypothetical protein [Icmadophila ericetorum]